LTAPPWVCPACAADLEAHPDQLLCRGCGRVFPVLAGVADLRLEPDRFLSLEADRAKGLAVLRAGEGGYEAALQAYWGLTPELEPALAQGHRKRQLAEDEAGAALAREVVRRCGSLQGPALDLGCGLGGFVAAAASHALAAVGIDAAFRWTAVASLRLRQAGVDAALCCANAEHPPFRPGSFELVVANDLLEHVRDPAAVLEAAARMLRPGGRLYAASTHRYSLAPEPHVRLLGVGWLPRSWQSAYVRMRRGHAYDKVRPVSAGELAELVRGAGLEAEAAFAAPVFAGHLGPTQSAGLAALQRLRWAAPRIGVVARRPAAGL
jgi:SAM-dependent methyltransferase